MTRGTNTDGRRARGAASRDAIVEAGVAVVVANGLDAVTHRAVAQRAGVSLARTTYHFPTIDELVDVVRIRLTNRFDERLVELVSTAADRRRSVIDAACEFLEELLGPRRHEFLATIEIAVAAARRPGLLPVRDASITGVVPIIASFGYSTREASTIFAAMYGFAVLAATQPDPIPIAEIRNYVSAIISDDRSAT